MNYLNNNNLFYCHFCFGLIYLFLWYKSKPKTLKITIKSKSNRLILFFIAFILLTTFLIAIYSPPNNWDSHTDHMARTSHWIQNESVDFFPTNNYRQNSYAPFSEYVLLNIKLLTNSDVLMNLVQWFCFIICIIIISLISKEYGQNITFQLFWKIIYVE